MGAQIAAHLANAGLDSVLLLDVTADAAAAGLKRLADIKPDPRFTPDVTRRITTGSFEVDLPSLRAADWIIEAVVESLDHKRDLLGRAAPHAATGAVLTTNTSGIPIADIASILPATLQSRFAGTHFFNPPRYLRLLELIAGPSTSPETLDRLADFADRRLGKGVVVANDTPGFIANRLGIYGALRALDLAVSGEFTIEEIDAVLGPAIGRPKSATFRTLDLAGLDIFEKVASDLAARLGDPASYGVPAALATMVERGLLGVKTGRGFYRRASPDPGAPILTLDLSTMDYRPFAPPALPSIAAADRIADPMERLRALHRGRDRAGEILRRTLDPLLEYAAAHHQEIARSPEDVDRAMRLGFGWDLGPFETRAALEGLPNPRRSAHATVATARATGVIKSNAGASLVDLGDDVVCVEFHSKLNTLGGDAMDMLRAGVEYATRQSAGLVIGNDAEHFSAGANLMLVLLEAQEGNWDEIDAMVRAFQATTMALKTAGVPVVAAVAGMTLGGGCEIALHSARVRAAAETYMGLVEVGVGLLPAGGGTKELLLRAIDRAGGADAGPFVQDAFQTIGFGKLSTSALDARLLGYLREADAITMNRDRLLEDAKRDVLALAAPGYVPVAPRQRIPVAGAGLYASLSLGVHLAHRAGRISDHDALIGRKIARVLAGGDGPHATSVTEQRLLDLEREAFLSLCGEQKTVERIAHTLKTGKTLRN
jgi:3-hydroxyacyl-CoA dehydrogenase